MSKYAMFWGCTIPARFPYLEKSIRLALEGIGTKFEEIDGFTCCPERSLVKHLNEDAWHLTAARNLAVAEKHGLSILTPCTGCHSVLKTVRATLLGNPPLRQRINEQLSKVGLEFTGSADVVHIAEYLFEEVGVQVISKKVKNPLWGTKVAVHYGCHLVRPTPHVRWDNSIHPVKLEGLISALGATVVNYESKELCCGSYLGRVGQQEGALSFSRKKLKDIKEQSTDALAVVCPSCFQQFDLNQSILIRQKENLGIPVLYLTELMALALGHSPDEMGLSMHRVDTSGFIERLETKKGLQQFIAENFSLADLERCFSCRACKSDCPSAKIDPTFDPTAVIGRVLAGDIDALLESGDIWKCIECDLCHELCPQKYSMDITFHRLKQLAIERGVAPRQIASSVNIFKESGLLGVPRESEREKLGLPKLPDYGTEQWQELLKDVFE